MCGRPYGRVRAGVETVSSLTFRRATVVTEVGILRDHAVSVIDGRITGVMPDNSNETLRAGDVDLAGRTVLPGLVDTHLHGALGATFNQVDQETWEIVLNAHLANGSTTMVPTLVTDRMDVLIDALQLAGSVDDRLKRLMKGVHLEGPYLSKVFSGAHPQDWLRNPEDNSWVILNSLLDRVTIATVAPELPGSLELIDKWRSAGVAMSAGHSGASPDQLVEAVTAGITHATHLWSGQSVLTKVGPWRQPGLLEAVLSSDQISAELIADGVHLPAELVRIAYRCLGPDRLCLVSDASAGTGLPVGSTFEMGPLRGHVVEGVAMACDGASFCGSTSYLFDILRFAVNGAGLPICDAIKMASLTPAKLIGVQDDVGSIAVGKRADLLVVDDHLRLIDVYKSGNRLSNDGVPTTVEPVTTVTL